MRTRNNTANCKRKKIYRAYYSLNLPDVRLQGRGVALVEAVAVAHEQEGQAHAAAQAEKRASPEKFHRRIKSKVAGNMKSQKKVQKRTQKEAKPPGVKLGYQAELEGFTQHMY